MITQYRSAYNNFYKAPTFSGRSVDTKPVNVENGAVYLANKQYVDDNVVGTSMTVYITSIGGGTYR